MAAEIYPAAEIPGVDGLALVASRGFAGWISGLGPPHHQWVPIDVRRVTNPDGGSLFDSTVPWDDGRHGDVRRLVIGKA